MYLRQIELDCYDGYKRTRDFHMLSASPVHLYKRCLPKTNGRTIGKVVIEAVQAGDEQAPLDDGEGVLLVSRSFDFGALWRSRSELGRCKTILTFVHRSLLSVAPHYGWDTESFKEAHREALRRDLANEEHVGKPVASPNRQLRAQIYYSFGTKMIKVLITITNRDGEVVKQVNVKRMRAHEGEYGFHHLLGKLRWLSNKQLQLTSAFGDWKKNFKLDV